MLHIRDKKTDAIAKRSTGPKVEISASNDDLPLKHENWMERWCTLPSSAQNVAEQLLNFEVRPDDVFLVTFMKSGTTWIQEAAWLLMNQVDLNRARDEDLVKRSPYLEFEFFNWTAPKNTDDTFYNEPSPRLIKTHLPVNLLPKQLWQKKQKIIFLARNVKDVVVSSYHFLQQVKFWCNGTLDDFVEDFMNNELMFTPFWPRLLDFWQLRHEPYIFFVTYEEMSRDLAGVLQRLCKFLDRPELSNEELEQLVDHLSFQRMKDNKRTNLKHIIHKLGQTNNPNFEFMRRGIVGAYKDELTAEQIRLLDLWSSEFLNKHGLKEEDIFGKI